MTGSSGDLRIPPVALTIAGSDSGGGAGIQADLKTFVAMGVWGTTALTAVTAQNTLGVASSLVLSPSMIRAQIAAVAEDMPPAAAKTGMLGSEEAVRAVAGAVAEHRIPNLVVDPVLVSGHGDELAEKGMVDVLRAVLLPMATVVTPNLDEAEALLEHPVTTVEEMEQAARELAALGPPAVVVKGGHLGGDRCPDALWLDGRVEWFDGPRWPGRANHGTGCTLSAALCAQLARGAGMRAAYVAARELVTGAIRHAPFVGHGIGPVDPTWTLFRRS